MQIKKLITLLLFFCIALNLMACSSKTSPSEANSNYDWDIVGKYYASRSSSSSNATVTLYIDDYNSSEGTVSGKCYCYLESPMTFSEARETYTFTDLPVDYNDYSYEGRHFLVTLTNNSPRTVYVYFFPNNAKITLAGPVFGGWDSDIERQ